MGNNRLRGINQVQVLECQIQHMNLYIVKNSNPLQPSQTNYMYYLTRNILTVDGSIFEEVVDFFHTTVANLLWDYALYSHMNNFSEPDQQFLEFLLQEINELIA